MNLNQSIERIPMAIDYQINPIPIAIACAVGANLAMATPVANTTITMVQVAGYRFKDYFRVGGLVGFLPGPGFHPRPSATALRMPEIIFFRSYRMEVG